MYVLLWFSSSITTENIFKQKSCHQKFLWKFFPRLLSLRKWFCNNKKIRPKLLIKVMKNCSFIVIYEQCFWRKTCSSKKLSIKNFCENFARLLSLRKWFCNNKKFRPKLLIKIMVNCTFYCDFRVVLLQKTFSSKKVAIKNFCENFSKVTIFEEMILQQ